MNTIPLTLVGDEPAHQGADAPRSPLLAGPEFPGFANVRDGAGEAEGVGLDRRGFLRLMGASAALAGVASVGCRRPDFEILPFARPPEDQVPGLPTFYATCQPRVGGAVPLLVENDEGRPTKVEGNPRHPQSLGSTDAFAQAAVLDLYHPDRSRTFLRGGLAATPADFDAALTPLLSGLKSKDGEGLRVLAQDVPSPLLRGLRARLAEALPKSAWHSWQPFDGGNARAGAEMAFGERADAVVDYATADVVIALDCDFLGLDGGVAESRAFSARRRIDNEKHDAPKLNRLYVVEPTWSVTGTMADHRLRLPASQCLDFLLLLARDLFDRPGKFNRALRGQMEDVHKRLTDTGKGYHPDGHPLKALFDRWVKEVRAELERPLERADARAVLVVGPRQPALAHALAAAVNEEIGASRPLTLAARTLPPVVTYRKPADTPGLPVKQLADDLKAGKVECLLVLEGNPAFDAPADLGLKEAIRKAKVSVHVGLHADETAAVCSWHVPGTHFLEQWGDAEAADGSYCLVQPLIAPLIEAARSPAEVLARFAGVEKPASLELLKESFAKKAGSSDEAAFKTALQVGFLADSAVKPVELAVKPEALAAALKAYMPPGKPAADRVEVNFLPCYRLYDGRYAGNAWLQELPDPITKVTWDNTALVSPATARKLGVGTGDLLTVAADGGRQVSLPVFVLPGHADDCVGLRVGGGRTRAGRVGSIMTVDPTTGALLTGEADGGGVDAYPLRTTETLSFAVLPADRFTKAPGTYALAMTQEHSPITTQHGRDLVRIVTTAELAEKSHAAEGHHDEPHGPPTNLSYTNPLDEGQGWGMVVDLHLCTGCSACMIACQAENNVPVVGKGEVSRGRDMHWIRLDRYFLTGAKLGYGDADDQRAEDVAGEVGLASQPVMCVHCEAAPCELVCPVNAAVHSPEGLNLQVYNRCIGTRYCSNNCPYKARRFNWFDYNQRPLDALRAGPLTDKGMPELLKMSKNPDVTVRMRGVMEKCTYCVQRIERAKIGAKLAAMRRATDGGPLEADLRVPDGVITPACAQACPSAAITFGNVKDPDSRVARLKRHNPRDYLLLGELNTFPRTSYLARVRNPNPRLADEKGGGK